MAIAFDAATDGGAGGSPLTFSHTCSGENRILFVACVDDTGGSSLITGITYAGVAMTKIAGVQTPTDRWVTLWYLIAPATGANNVVITLSGGMVYAAAASYTGAKQSGVPDAYTSNTASNAPSITCTLTTIADNCWLVGSFKMVYGTTPSSGANTYQRLTADYNRGLLDSNGAQTPAGSKSMSLSKNNQWWGMVMASFAPYVVSGPANLKSLNTNLKANIKSYNTNLIANVKSINTNV